VHEYAAWLTVYVCPAIVRTAVRAAPVFAVAVTVTVPDPVPAAGLTFAHVDVPIAVQLHAEPLALTATVALPPVAVAAHEVADSA
jgi:hypothetical protein